MVPSCAAVGSSAEQLADALSTFVGLRPPNGPVAVRLTHELLGYLDRSVPVGSVATRQDLWDASESAADKSQGQLIPPIPDTIAAAAGYILRVTAALSAAEAREAAVQLGVSESDTRYSAFLLLSDDRSDGPLDLQEIGDWTGVDDHEFGIEAALDRITHVPIGQWSSTELDIVRQAVSFHLARIGDAFLWTSEHVPVLLEWRTLPDGSLRADHQLPERGYAITAVVAPDQSSDDNEELHELFGSERLPAASHYCSVGAFGDDGRFEEFASSRRHPSRNAAQFAAAELTADLQARRHAVRSRGEHRLLVPRRANDHYGDRIILTLGMALLAVAEQHGLDSRQGAPGWTTHPHRDQRYRLLSVTAMVLDAWNLPFPKLTETASDSSADDEEFADFLKAQGVCLTKLAKLYLVGLGDAGPAPQPIPLADRHAAAMRSVLLNADHTEIVAEIFQPHPHLLTPCGAESEMQASVDAALRSPAQLLRIEQVRSLLWRYHQLRDDPQG